MIHILSMSELPQKRNDTVTFDPLLCISRYQELFRKSLKGACTFYWFLLVGLYLLLVLRVTVEFQVHKLTVKLFRKTYA